MAVREMSVVNLVLSKETDPERRLVRGLPRTDAVRSDLVASMLGEEDETEVPLEVVTRDQIDLLLVFWRTTRACDPASLEVCDPVKSARLSDNVHPLPFAAAAAHWSFLDAVRVLSAAKYLGCHDAFRCAVAQLACFGFGRPAARIRAEFGGGLPSSLEWGLLATVVSNHVSKPGEGGGARDGAARKGR
jgi:hypothetical protein